MRARPPLLAVLVLALGVAGAEPAGAATPRLAEVGTFSAPVFVGAPLGDTSRVVVVERGGTIRLLEDGVLQARPFLDVSASVLGGDERGLLSVAFDRDYLTNGRLWIFYTARSPAGQLTIEELRRSATDPDVADPATRRVVLAIPHGRFGNHNGGQLQVGPDGALYVGTGDGGGGGDPFGNGQRLTGDPANDGENPRLGKILRLDPATGGVELFAAGLRNPWRFSFDRATGDLVIGDVGQGAYEEVDVARAPLAAGANFGWNRFEGRHAYPGGGAVSDFGRTVPPVLERSHADGWVSVTGGYVVRDRALPELAGRYVFGDYGKGDLEAADLATGDATATGLHVDLLSSFGEDGCGRVYAVSLDGPVSRLETTGACAGAVPFAGYLPSGSAPAAAPDGGGAGAGGGGAPAARPLVVRFSAATRQRALRIGRLRLLAGCDARCSLLVSGRITARRRRAAAAAAAGVGIATATARAQPAAGARVPVDVRLGPKARRSVGRWLRRGRVVTATLRLTARDAAGRTSRRLARVRIVR